MKNWPQVAMVTLAVFAMALGISAWHNPFVFDDVWKIVDNPDIRSFDLHRLIFRYTEAELFNRNDPSRPVVFISYAINYALGGLSPFGFHLTNSLLHALNGVLAFLVLRHLVGRWLPEQATLFAFAAAALMLCSPVNTGTSIYISGRSDLMQATWLLLAVFFFLRSAGKFGPPYTACLAAYALALFTKQSAVILPVLVIAIDSFNQPERNWRALWAARGRYLPLFGVTAAYLLYRQLQFGGFGDLEGRDNLWPVGEYIKTEPYVIMRYIGLLLAPTGLSIDHQVLPWETPTGPLVAGWLLVTGLVIGIIYAARRPSPSAALLALSGVWFFVCLAPTSSFLPTVDAMVERRLYLASLGFYLALIVLLHLAVVRLELAPHVRPLALGLTVLLLVAVFSAVTLWRNQVHSTPERLWKSVIAEYPRSLRAHNDLAHIYLDARRYDEAAAIYDQIAKWNPEFYMVWNNIGALYDTEDYDKRDPARALAAYERAMQLAPGFPDPYYNAGKIHERRGELDLAKELYRKATTLDPNFVPAHQSLSLLEQGAAPVPPAQPGFQIPEGAHEVRPEDLSDDILKSVFADWLRGNPNDDEMRLMFAKECLRRKLPCAKEQYGILAAHKPANQEYRKILQTLH